MPVNQTIWTLDDNPRPLDESSLDTESQLEDLIELKPEVIDPELMIIGRQVQTPNRGRIDLLALDATGSIVIIELKRDKTPRDVTAQALDYASWAVNIESDAILEIYTNYKNETEPNASLREAFRNKFNQELEEQNLNQNHQIIIVASEMDSSTERIIDYLNQYDIPINIIFFKVYSHNEQQLISRAWFLDPQETKENATAPAHKAPWNGEYYCSFGHDENRDWEDARKYGFISAGGGSWYSKTLFRLNLGDKVWVNIPHTGYVGYGEVNHSATIAHEYKFDDFESKTIYELANSANYHSEHKDNPDLAEYIVRIEWIKTVSIDEAVREIGFFGNQHIICRPTAEKWLKTLSILNKRWALT